MASQISVYSLVMLALWAGVIFRFFVVLRRGSGQSGPAQRSVWWFWGVFFCLTLAATAYHPAVQKYLETQVGAWFGSVPRTLLAMAGYLLGVHIAYDLAPHLQPRWNWPAYLGALTSVTYILLAWAVGLGHLKQSPGVLTQSLVGSTVFNYFLLLLVARIGLPVFLWAWQRERQRPMRLRFLIMLATHAGIGAWALTGIVEALTLVVDGSLPYALAYNSLSVFCAVTFTLSYLMPAQYYVAATRVLDYLANLRAFVFIRFLELAVTGYTDRRFSNVTFAEVVRTPETAVYRSVIAIFDGRKLLQIQPTLPARILAAQLETATRIDLEYPEVVRCLARLGQEAVRRWPAQVWRRWCSTLVSRPENANV